MVSRSFCWTLNNYTEEELKIVSAFENNNTHRYSVVAKEIGESGTPHLQGYTEMAKPMRMIGFKKAIGLQRAHVETRKGTREEARDYCRAMGEYAYKMATDPAHTYLELGSWDAGGQGARIGAPAKSGKSKKESTFVSLVDDIRDGMKWEALLEKYPALCVIHRKNILDIIESQSRQEQLCELAEEYEKQPLRPWQKELEERAEAMASMGDDRHIQWICDTEGGTGKSWYIRYKLMTMGIEKVFTANCSAMKDIAYAYKGQPLVYFDLPRTQEEKFAYGTVEALKDGKIFSSKYESQMKIFKPPTVIVFANFIPDRRMLSKDRWIVCTVEKNQLKEELGDPAANPVEPLEPK